jgi:hypothetical protein
VKRFSLAAVALALSEPFVDNPSPSMRADVPAESDAVHPRVHDRHRRGGEYVGFRARGGDIAALRIEERRGFAQ